MKKISASNKMARAIQGPNQATNFMNSNHRRIFRSAGGRYFVRTAEGSKQYKPKASYHSMPGNNKTSAVHASHSIPAAIRPKGLRARKSTGSRFYPVPVGLGNRGLGPNMRALFATPEAPKRRGRAPKYTSNENRKAAKRAAARKYYARKRAGLLNMPRL
jgi:hypothetical protein